MYICHTVSACVANMTSLTARRLLFLQVMAESEFPSYLCGCSVYNRLPLVSLAVNLFSP